VERPDAVDGRLDRYGEGAIGVFLLACFVFGFVYGVPLVAFLVGIPAIGGARYDVQRRLWTGLAERRLGPGDAFVAGDTIRAQQALLAGLCVLATLAFFVARPLGWLLVLVAALAAVLAATTGVHLGDQLWRFTRR
jgi:hypothetical protein